MMIDKSGLSVSSWFLGFNLKLPISKKIIKQNIRNSLPTVESAFFSGQKQGSKH